MSPQEQADAFLQQVTREIRGKRVRLAVAAELRDHIAACTAALAQAGVDEAAACSQALRELGDPTELGRRFDRVHNPKSYPFFIGALLLLAVLLRTGGPACLWDPSSGFLLVSGVLLTSGIHALRARRWGLRRFAARCCAVWGAALAAASLCFLLASGAAAPGGWLSVLLPLWYGMAACSLLSIRPPLSGAN